MKTSDQTANNTISKFEASVECRAQYFGIELLQYLCSVNMVYVEPKDRFQFMVKKTELFMKLLMCNIMSSNFQKKPKSFLIVVAALFYIGLCFYTIITYDINTKMKCMCIVSFTFQVSIVKQIFFTYTIINKNYLVYFCREL